MDQGGNVCIAVPVQILETWLLVARGEQLPPTPEQRFSYSRANIKKAFFGSGREAPQSQARRLEMAMKALSGPDALLRLRRLRSFQHFEGQLASWS